MIVNPSARTRGGTVEIRLPGTDVPDGCQLVSERPAERMLLDDTAVEVATVMVAELEYVRNILSFTIDDADGDELLHVEREDAGTLVTPPVRRALAAVRDARAGENVRVRVTNNPAVTVLAHVADVAGYGWQAWTGAAAVAEPVTTDDWHLANGSLTVEVDPLDGTFAIDGHTGLGALVDGGDVGDTYNWCPPLDDTLVDAPTSVSTRVRRGGTRARTPRGPPHLRAPDPRRRRRSRRAHRRSRCAPPSSCTRATTSSASTSSSTTTGCATTGSGSTCPCPSEPPPRWRSARSPRSSVG